MAKNPPKGPGRVGAVKDRVQVFNPKNKRWTKVDTKTNLFMDQNSKANKKFKGITKK
ncbi:MAG: hypothetical protein UT02_C0014G0020 [Parcubacteria group bacterium GW2011_GWC2_38_7]|nr:MAG: hypothetical protein UT02_C0014G0020 [Parcubacteria group bacterium GW2011_GWC2_38_7]